MTCKLQTFAVLHPPISRNRLLLGSEFAWAGSRLLYECNSSTSVSVHVHVHMYLHTPGLANGRCDRPTSALPPPFEAWGRHDRRHTQDRQPTCCFTCLAIGHRQCFVCARGVQLFPFSLPSCAPACILAPCPLFAVSQQTSPHAPRRVLKHSTSPFPCLLLDCPVPSTFRPLPPAVAFSSRLPPLHRSCLLRLFAVLSFLIFFLSLSFSIVCRMLLPILTKLTNLQNFQSPQSHPTS